MLTKFISMSETRFQNTEIVLKNQQASIQGLKTQIGQLSKLIFERPQGSSPSNTEPNPRENLNAINVQDEEGFVESEPEPRQETVVSKGQGELTLRVGDETITLQVRNSGNTSEIKGDHLTHSTKTDNTVGDKVLLDATDPHIVATTSNEEIPLTVLSIFPFIMVEVFHRDTAKSTGVLKAV
ncbi:hypothetical protein GOBAR_AA06169 [Gossypium barbadense]|uniref:Uncharacterized protein n=1 Tax=Gossypium barbadense TaxID=3634 RepID=A0A2P5YFT4_GOSBA|nr:hypothetical protein GOBAR_AA06169 [Gossypium barbadense]